MWSIGCIFAELLKYLNDADYLGQGTHEIVKGW
jgi:hypothetical protein